MNKINVTIHETVWKVEKIYIHTYNVWFTAEDTKINILSE